jgi:hypothetical protein
MKYYSITIFISTTIIKNAKANGVNKDSKFKALRLFLKY